MKVDTAHYVPTNPLSSTSFIFSTILIVSFIVNIYICSLKICLDNL